VKLGDPAWRSDDPSAATGGVWNRLCLVFIIVVYVHNTVPYLTMMPRVNVDEPWLMERAYQVLETGVPRQPMYGLDRAYLLQPGYSYVLAPWLAIFGVGIAQARALGVVLGLGITLMLAAIGRRLLDARVGLAAAALLVADSNFLGGVRNARTDIPAVFFVAAALLLFLEGRSRGRAHWYFASGIATGLAVLCHGNSYWVALVLCAWYLLENWRRMFTASAGYAYAAGLMLSFGPYLAILAANWSEFRDQVYRFASDRVPGGTPLFVLRQLVQEPERYRNWYFGLVTNTVPNPLLWSLQISTVIGVGYVVYRLLSKRTRSVDAPALRLLATLVLGAVFIFAGFINNKAHVYMPHLVLGFCLVAATFVRDVGTKLACVVSRLPGLRLRDARVFVIPLFVGLYGSATIVYYQKWYSITKKSELTPYEVTEHTIRTMLPSGPKVVYASPHFWLAFHNAPTVTFFSHAWFRPESTAAGLTLGAPEERRPLYLLIDATQWRPELTSPAGYRIWQQPWLDYIRDRCAPVSFAPGTAYGTLAAYVCSNERQPEVGEPFVAGPEFTYRRGPTVFEDAGARLARWKPSEDPRRRSGLGEQVIELTGDGLRVAGSQWPGATITVSTEPGQSYLLATEAAGVTSEDLVFIGRWEPSEATSLSGAANGGIVVPLNCPSWFPSAQAFTALANRVRLLYYSEARHTDFRLRKVTLYKLTRATTTRHELTAEIPAW